MITVAADGQAIVLDLPEVGMPRIVHWGADVAIDPPVGRASRINGMDIDVPSRVLLPTGGLGFFGMPAIAGHVRDGDWVIAFGAWRSELSPGHATLHARDAVNGLALTMTIAITDGMIVLRSRLENRGDAPFVLERCCAGSVPLDTDTVDTFHGTWGAEFHLVTEPLGAGTWLRENRRGRTSHDRTPAVFWRDRHAFWGAHLGASANHVIAIDRLDDGTRLLHAGEWLAPGECALQPGDSYDSPALHVARAPTADARAAVFHRHVRRLLGPLRPRPVTLNTWEGNYFDHRLPALQAQATAAAALGVERFVLDDGWFGHRDDDSSSLGDWTVDRRKYPDGLEPLIAHVRGLGMEFGLWFEPEMVSPDSDFYRAHPDWAIVSPGRDAPLSRKQLVLDLAKPGVTDALFDAVHAILRAHDIAYVKWDMNRDITGGRAMAQVRALHALLDRLRAAHPDIEIESCASGGGRADYGMLARTQRVWVSDCTDALERLEIQRGASMLLPPEVMGAHLSASPNHQTGRRHSVAFRALTALPYHFGIEIDPTKLAPVDRRILGGWIVLHKRLRSLFHTGIAFRADPVDGRHVYGWRSADARHVVVFVAQTSFRTLEQPPVLRVPDLPNHRYRATLPGPAPPDFVRATPQQRARFAGGILRGITLGDGVDFPALRPESAALLELTAQD